MYATFYQNNEKVFKKIKIFKIIVYQKIVFEIKTKTNSFLKEHFQKTTL